MGEAEWNVSAGLKKLKTAKRKVELKEKNHENVKLKEDVPGEIASSQSQKNQRAPRITTADWKPNCKDLYGNLSYDR